MQPGLFLGLARRLLQFRQQLWSQALVDHIVGDSAKELRPPLRLAIRWERVTVQPEQLLVVLRWERLYPRLELLGNEGLQDLGEGVLELSVGLHIAF